MSQNNNQPVRRSRRLATIIPASHWISIGYSQAQATAMEKLQNDIKEYCDSSGDVNVDLNGRNDNGDTLPHHDMMIPHWKKLATSLSGRTCGKDRTLQYLSTSSSIRHRISRITVKFE